MKKLLGTFLCVCMATVLSIGSTGCQKETKGKDISLSDPSTVKMKAGETKIVDLKYTRATEAKSEIKLEVKSSDDNVKATIDPTSLASPKVETKVTIVADKDKAKDATITVTAKSEGSKDVVTKIEVKIDAKVSGDDKGIELAKIADVTVDAGKSTDVALALVRGKAATHKIELTTKVEGGEKGHEKGLTATVDPVEVPKDEKVKLTIKTDNTAKGDYHVTVTAKSKDATDVPQKFKVTVKEVKVVDPKDPKVDPKDPKVDPKDPKVDPKTDKVEIKIKDVGETELLKKGDTKVKIEITEKAPEDLAVKVWAKGVEDKVLTGKGTIKKGETSTDVTITTVDVDAKLTEITATITSAGTKDAETKIKTKVKAK